MNHTPPPLSPLESKINSSRSAELGEGTPVGDRDKDPKVQLCIELRRKETVMNAKREKTKELVLEVAVMYIKNPPSILIGKIRQPTFVKIRLCPGEVIHSTELKRDKKNEEKMDFIEVFDFPLQNAEDIKGKKIELLVCDKKMTRNANIFGRTEIDVGDICMGKPVCKWYTLKSRLTEG